MTPSGPLSDPGDDRDEEPEDRHATFICDCPCPCGVAVDYDGEMCTLCAEGDHGEEREPDDD